MHECLKEVEEENEYQEAEDIDQEVEDEDKGQKGIEIPTNYGLFKMDGQFKALCGVLDIKKKESMELSESKFKECNGLLHKFRNDKAKIGWANRVWDPGKSFMDHHFWEVTHCMGALRSLNPLGHTNFKHWWGFKDEFKHKPP
ncbi:hypothetical protein PIB30_074516 [Stylosanthes scabra]|uniref:Uncharacterized protein n=1 Tax=Stylosanthes scabra TaxID=79078 RepID=A0ABU6QPF7_9FABA|nr:hypothetical protein [Stylosanthes scabra]